MIPSSHPIQSKAKMPINHLHIFLSSLGDVSRERQLAREVIDRIQSERAYRDKIKLEVVAWDKPGAGTAMPAHLEPQEAINRGLKKPSQCDIVIVIFWARMGTHLSDRYAKPGGGPYHSGTEYEFFESLETAQKTGKPHVLVYRRKKPPAVDLDDLQRDEKIKQWNLVESFFSEFRNPDGSFKRFYKVYDEPFDFEKELAGLRDILTFKLFENRGAMPSLKDGSNHNQKGRMMVPSANLQPPAPFGGNTVAVGMWVSPHPPHGSRRAELPHRALALKGETGTLFHR
jgi:hypothetical protein